MALKALMIKRQIDLKRKSLKALQDKAAEFTTREADLKKAIEEVETDEQRSAVDEMIAAFDQEKAAHDQAVTGLKNEIAGLERDLEAEEAKQNTDPPANPTNDPQTHAGEERRNESMNTRVQIPGMTLRDRLANIVTRQEVMDYLAETRAAIKEKRAINNVGLTIPTVMLGLLRENVLNYSKLYRHVTVRPVGGEARMLIMGNVPEAIWTDCCANLNELSITFNDMEVDCFKVGGFFAVCNANLEDSDVDLAAEIMSALGQAIGIALDKAILYGRNAATTMKMPQGVVSRLVQESRPDGYPATARPWVDLHTSNVITIQAGTTGAALFAAIVTASGAMKGKYSRGEKVWVMNETTYTALIAATVTTNASGQIVAGVNGVMPVVGGIIEVLSFLPDNVIIGGYFDLYILAERRGARFASSEHVRFLQDQTVMKGTARYDGAPAIAEAFVLIGINGTTPTAAMSFPTDVANDPETIWLPATATVKAGESITLAPVITPKGVATTLTWASGTEAKATVSTAGVVTGVAAGTSVITATTENGLTAQCTVTVTSA
ncbi:MAG: phage major capsid protein [Clostridia bacterium]|nr:phage major capsid protein [Clostridia bacterium]